MAVKVLTVASVKAANDFITATPETATVASDGFIVTADGDVMLLVSNVSADTAYDITVKKGNAPQGTADYLEEIAAGASAIIKLESGKFKNVTGTNKGKWLIIPEHVDVHVKAFTY